MEPEVAEIDARAREAGLPMLPVIERAGLAYTTWTRWKQGASPNLKHLKAVQSALDSLLQERAA